MPATTLPFRCFLHWVLMLTGLLWASAVCAQSFTVNTEADITDAAPGNGICAATTGQCSLRAAIMEANAQSGKDTILLGNAIYTRSIVNSSGDEDACAEGDLDITDALVIQGAGANQSIIDANQKDRVFHVLNGVSAEFRNITIRNGLTSGDGGGIKQDFDSTVVIKNSTLSGNEVSSHGSYGGGLFVANGSKTTIENTAIIRNHATGGGGGISCFNNYTGPMNIINSTISGNSASSGGAIYTAIANLGLYIVNTTITDNDASPRGGMGGGIFNIGSGLVMSNSILAGNRGRIGADCSVAGFNSLGYNLVGDETGCMSKIKAVEGDQIGTASNPINPLLGPLTNNGGPTLTHALLPNSPALDAGSPLPVGQGGNACEPTDQRGQSRTGHGLCDIGAYEATNGADAWLNAMIAPNTTPSRERVQYQLTVGNTGPQRVKQLTLTLTPPRNSSQTTVTGEGWTCTVANSLYTCQREALNAGSESLLDVHLTPPPGTNEITLEGRVETVSQDIDPANNQATLTTVINRPPQVRTPGLIRYDPQGKPAPISPSLTIDDDDTHLRSASLRFAQGYRLHEDTLTAPNTTTLISHWQADQATLTLSGIDTVSAYEQALRAVVYENTAAHPARHARALSISVADAYTVSEPAPVQVELIGADDGPLPGAQNPSGDANPFVSDIGGARVDAQKSHTLAHRLPPETSEQAWRGGRDEEGGHAAAGRGLMRSGNDATRWQESVRSMKYDDEWTNIKEINTKQDRLITNISILSSGAVIIAGVVNFYIRSLSFLGIFFSSPLLISFDPAPIVSTSKKERVRRRKSMEQAENIENRDGRLGALLDDKLKGNT